MIAFALTLLLSVGGLVADAAEVIGARGPVAGGVEADPGDTVTIPRTEYDALLRRIERIEGLVGPHAGNLSAVQALSARLDAGDARAAGGLRVFYKDGLRVEDPNGDVKLKFGGRIHFTLTHASGDSDLEQQVGSLEDGAEFRRVRWKATGSVTDQLDWAAEYDFAGGDASFKDMYLRFKQVPYIGNVMVGHFKEPSSLEEAISAASQPLIERSPVTALTHSEGTGVMTRQVFAGGRMQAQLGVFRDSVNAQGADAGDGENAVSARVTGLPIDDPTGNNHGGRPTLLHLGAHASRRSVDGDMIRFRARPEAHQLQRFVDTGSFPAESVEVAGAEIAFVSGPLWIQAELVDSQVESEMGGDPEFSGHYILVAYYLTGESQPYDRGKGRMGRAKPNDPFLKPGGSRGLGAWQLVMRSSTLDLNDGTIVGGNLRDTAYGVNWLLDDTTRIMFNYIRSHLDRPAFGGHGDIFVVAFQKDF